MALKPGQLKCIQTLDKPIVVAAGAGSGKTFTLTKRIVGALESGYIDDIGQVCAITFTNKAAAELKSRIKAELRACGLAEQALKVDDAWISTIHGMCARILRSHAIELGIDPAFQVASGPRVQELMDQAVDAVLHEAELMRGAGDSGEARGELRGSDGAFPREGAEGGIAGEALEALFAEYQATSESYGASSVEGMVQLLIDKAAAHPRGVAAFYIPDQGYTAAPLLKAALDAYRQLLDAAELEKPGNRRDEWLTTVGEAYELASAQLAQGQVGTPVEALHLLAGMKCTKGFGSKAFKQQVDELSGDIDGCVMELRLAAARGHLHTLVALAGRAFSLFSGAKRREGLLDNSDLLVLAAQAVEQHPQIAACYVDKFKLVMVDEFQDTDQMQVDMIKRIAGPGAQRLCTVGDAQQSIYRFRGADVSVYRRHLATVRDADPDGIILLPDNFRSHPDVLSLVDCVFGRDDMFGGEFMSLAPGRDEAQVRNPYPADEPRVRVQLGTKAHKNGVPSDLLVQHQARRVAATFAHLRDKGRRPGEMAVLLGRMANAGVFAAALRERGLACVISGGSVFAQSAEAQQVLELARAIANPRDTEALYNVLAGPMFHLADDDFALLGTCEDAKDGLPRGRGLDAGMRALARARRDGDAVGGSPQLDLALRVLDAAWRGAGRSTMARVLMRAVLDSGWVSRLEADGPEGLAAAGNVYKAIRMVEGIEAEQTAGPLSVVREFEAELACSKEAPGALSAKGGDFVRIMTVHASKGLEFPIVAVAEFKDAGGDSSKLLALGDGDRIYLSLDLGRSLDKIGGSVKALKPAETYALMAEGRVDEDALMQMAREAEGPLERRAAIYEHGRLGDEEEGKRLLYVALTRAKEALVVSTIGSRTQQNPNGTPKNCLGALVRVLAGSEDGFDPGRSSFDFGGSAMAVVEHDALELLADGSVAGACAAEDDASPAAGSVANPLFPVPAEDGGVYVARIPHAPAHEGIFSYSAVAEASHKGGLLEALAQRFAVSCDAAAPFGFAVTGEEAADNPGFLYRQVHDDRLSAMGDEDDGSWAYLGSNAGDADKSTDFGTAFHRLAQLAVLARMSPGRTSALQMPPARRIRSMLAACGLGGRQWSRLDDALERWFGCDEARRMEEYADLQAEVPFIVVVPGARGEEPAYLEGEIDLLAWDTAHEVAQVVDYKTGGHPDEPEAELRCKHVLQASCYAYSLLLQGAREVEASFVRVERGRADDPRRPQCVRYRFAADDASTLAAAIAQAYRQSRQ